MIREAIGKVSAEKETTEGAPIQLTQAQQEGDRRTLRMQDLRRSKDHGGESRSTTTTEEDLSTPRPNGDLPFGKSSDGRPLLPDPVLRDRINDGPTPDHRTEEDWITQYKALYQFWTGKFGQGLDNLHPDGNDKGVFRISEASFPRLTPEEFHEAGPVWFLNRCMTTYKKADSSWRTHKQMLDLGQGLPDQVASQWKQGMREKSVASLFDHEPFKNKELRALELKLTQLFFIRTFFKPKTERDVLANLASYRRVPANCAGFRGLMTVIGEEVRQMKLPSDAQDQKTVDLFFLYLQECYPTLFPRIVDQYSREMEKGGSFSMADPDSHLEAGSYDYSCFVRAVEGLTRYAGMVSDTTTAPFQRSTTFVERNRACPGKEERDSKGYHQPLLSAASNG